MRIAQSIPQLLLEILLNRFAHWLCSKAGSIRTTMINNDQTMINSEQKQQIETNRNNVMK